jgi:hypothetical protein
MQAAGEQDRTLPSRIAVTRRSLLAGAAATGIALGLPSAAFGVSGNPEDDLQRDFRHPPEEARAGVYWWWLDGAVSTKGITADLESMKQQGLSYALLFNAGAGGPNAPHGPTFMNEDWRSYFRFALKEAKRLGLALGVNVSDGWNCGGPWVTREEAVKDFVWGETEIEGPGLIDQILRTPSTFLPVPGTSRRVPPPDPIDWYRDIAVLACRESVPGVWDPQSIQDLTALTHEGRLRWTAPGGRWSVLRFGFVVRRWAGMDIDQGDHLVKNSVAPQAAWEIDPMSAGAMERHFAHTGALLLEDAGALAGSTLRSLHIDSWELGIPTWSEALPQEFRTRRGYDLVPYLPALAGKTLGSSEISARFEWDFRRTIADLIAQNYYGRFRELCQAHGVGTDCEAGGPFYTQYIDAMECLALQTVPMAEFWASRDWPLDAAQGVTTPFLQSVEREFPAMNFGSIKQAASTAHVYGHALCQAEAYTSTNADWSEDPHFLKSFGDRAFCLGLTRQILCFFVHQSTSDLPGYEWEHVGTHFDRNVTWWPLSHGWLDYIARCQLLLRQGVFAADLLYFSGQAIPNFALLDRKPVAGHDFDVINAQALLTRAQARDGKLVLPDGTSYAYFVLPEGAADALTPNALARMRELVEGGITLVGPRPDHSLGMSDYPRSEQQVREHVAALWGVEPDASGSRRVGSGRVVWGASVAELLQADALPPDVFFSSLPADAELDWLHRRAPGQDIYFLANLSARAVETEAVFRISGRVPELWNPVSGEIRELAAFRSEDARTAIPLRFAPRQSYFVVFRKDSAGTAPSMGSNFPELRALRTLDGPWDVRFDTRARGPGHIRFTQLSDWSRHADERIRYYSGMATYAVRFELSSPRGQRIFLDLGEVRNLAQLRLNHRDLGTLWTAPWRVEISAAVRSGTNTLEIDVVNLWPNRLIGDGLLPPGRRLTRTNVRTYDTPHPVEFADTEAEEVFSSETPALLPSGLLGPVTLLVSS